MSIWTREELGRLNTALFAKDNDAIQTLTNLYRQRTNMAVLKSSHPILIAVQENNSALLQYFLTSQNIDLKTLYHCIELCLVKNHKDIFQILTSKENQSKLGINLNYTMQVHQSLFPQSYGQVVSISILRLAVTCAKQHNDYTILENLLLQRNLKIDQTISTSTLSNCTELMLACLKQPSEKRDMNLIRLLIKAGADPYIQAEGNGTTISVIEYIEAVLRATPRDSEANEIMTLIQTELKHRGRRGRDSSPEHSSDSTLSTPRSVGSFSSSPKDGSPNGSPPQPSVMECYSPTNLRNDSPPGSPQLSDSGSAGSSPEKASTINKVVTGENSALNQIIIPPGDSLLCKEFLQAGLRKMYDLQKKMYDEGRIDLDCKCKICGKENILQRALSNNIELAKYMLYHPKNPANINSVNLDLRTKLHLEAAGDGSLRSRFPERNSILCVLYFSDKHPNVNACDKDGNTPLHLASACGGVNSHEAVEELLKAGADATLRNKEGLTAEQHCEKYCKEPDIKEKVIQELKKTNKIISLSSSIQHATNHSAITYNRSSQSSPSTINPNVVSYGANSAGIFSQRVPAGTQAPVSNRATSHQVGAVYAAPPLMGIQLPKGFRKPDMVIDAPSVVAQAENKDTKKSTHNNVVHKFKGLLGK